MKFTRFRPWGPAAALGLSLAAASAQASVVITFTQTASQVQAVWDGSFDTSYFTEGTAYMNRGFRTRLNEQYLITGPERSSLVQWRAGVSTSATLPFITGSTPQSGVFDGDDPVALFIADPAFVDTYYLWLPLAYVSGTNLHSAGTWNGSFSSLGLIPTATVLRLNGNQTITVNFVDTTANVPEPASAALAVLALACLGLSRRGAKLPINTDKQAGSADELAKLQALLGGSGPASGFSAAPA